MLARLSSAASMGKAMVGRKDDQSENTEASFTDEHHVMTRDELEYQASPDEAEVNEKIVQELAKRLIWGAESTSFGLRWQAGTVNDPELLLGGWLSQVSKTLLGGSVVNGPMRFCILDDDNKLFKQCLDEHGKTRREVHYSDIIAVRPRHQGKAWYLQVYNRESRWEFMPIDPTDRETLWRWVAALQLRSGTYDTSLTRQVTMANKAAVWTQSMVRMHRAKKRVQRRRERKNALLNRIKAAVGYNGWDDEDSDDEDDDDGSGALVYAQYALDLGTSVVNMTWSAVGSWLGLGGAPPLLEGDEPPEEEDAKSVAEGGIQGVPNRGRPKTRDSTFVQFSHELPALGPGEVEDEVWENQRWAVSSWNTVGLGVTERAPFSDRLGRGKFEDPRKPSGGVPLPAGWRALGEYTVDMSGRTKGRCDKDGWMFSSSFQLMDSDLAKGIFVAHNPGGLKGFVCRRRRWVRRRVPDLAAKTASLLDTTEPVLLMGWLGARTNATGRWTSRQYVLTRPGLRIGTVPEDLTSAVLSRPTGPALTCFRFNFRGVDDVLANGGTDASKWKGLTEADARTIQLDPRHCKIDETIATSAKPGMFALVIDGKSKIFNANDSQAREAWVAVISNALNEASRARRPRTLRLVGGAFETASYMTIIMDSVIIVKVDDVEEACFGSPAVQAAIVVRQGLTNPHTGAWANNERTIEYDSPTDGHVVEKHVRARSEKGVGYIVDREIFAPHAQFGEEFSVKMRFVLCSATFEKNNNCCRVIVSIDVALLKQTMMVGFIQSNARRNASVYVSEVWLPAVLGYLEGKGLVPPATKVEKKPSKFQKESSGKISVHKMQSTASGSPAKPASKKT